MSVRYETRFEYDSTDPKYFGTIVTASAFKLDLFKVVATQLFQGIYTLDKPDGGRHKPTAEVAGKTVVSGDAVFPFKGTDRDLFERAPWDVKIFTYSPLDDSKYVAAVLGIEVQSAVPNPRLCVCKFAARVIIPWKKVN